MYVKKSVRNRFPCELTDYGNLIIKFSPFEYETLGFCEVVVCSLYNLKWSNYYVDSICLKSLSPQGFSLLVFSLKDNPELQYTKIPEHQYLSELTFRHQTDVQRIYIFA